MSTESVMSSNHLILCHPLLLPPSIFPSIRVFSNESVLPIRWPKYWSFSFKMCPHGRRSSTEWLLPVSLCPGWVQLPLASLGGSPRPAAASDPGSIQIIASALGPGACEMLYAPFNSGVYFLQPSGPPKSNSCWPSKPNILGDHLHMNKYNFISKNIQSRTIQNKHDAYKVNIDWKSKKLNRYI